MVADELWNEHGYREEFIDEVKDVFKMALKEAKGKYFIV